MRIIYFYFELLNNKIIRSFQTRTTKFEEA